MNEVKENVDVTKLMKDYIDLQKELETLKQEKENYETLANETKVEKSELEKEVTRLQNVNHEFFLKLTNQQKEVMDNSRQNDVQDVTPKEEEEFNFDEFINKLV